ncbi:PD-(D/E)XK nuclease family protein [Pararhodobacter oceanensis]|uniref:PD-(D/E)XK nuclease family protein n=1 Tax=Pararhodobacter oceanensis TaxID=2172121 RepID=UPI003A8FDCC3
MMFEATTTPRVFGLPCGVDFPAALARGIRARMQGEPPEAMARVEVIVNTARVQVRLREALVRQGVGFLPQIRLISDLDPATTPTHPLRTRLALAQAVRALLKREPDLGPASSAFSLADGLYGLLDEMQGEGVDLGVLETLDVSNHSEHWTRSLRFIRVIADHFGPVSGGQGRLRAAIAQLTADWQVAPPDHPIIVAGSTGSRGPSALLMQGVAHLPQGALVLPGFDADLPRAVWQSFDNPLHSEDHPQFRFARLMDLLGIAASEVRDWTDVDAPDAQRNRIVSLALRPAPVTDQWLRDGPDLGDLRPPTEALTLIEAGSPRQEALAIALVLRQAAVDGKSAALITPDRTLARRVTAALDRWQVIPDDSAGRPLGLSAPGRFLRLSAGMFGRAVTAEALITLLKHPISHSATERGPHLRHLRELEIHLRRRAHAFPTAQSLDDFSARKPEREAWADWVKTSLTLAIGDEERDLGDWITAHQALAQHLAAGAGGAGSGELWLKPAGEAALSVFTELATESAYGGEMRFSEYSALLDTVLAGKEVRESVESRPDIMIWGTLEARAQSADIVVLGGLVDGTWPAAPSPDPWFNRQMRLDAGLLLPERQIGLSAHDFQIAIGAPEVVLSRAKRDAEAETVPSRWLNRLTNLILGLSAQQGEAALAGMVARGNHWLELADRYDADQSEVPLHCATRNPRPAPAPPLSARPRELPVTRIETLSRDPYAIYAEHVLRLKPMDPLAPEPDARLRGTVLHRVPEEYVRRFPPGTQGDVEAFMAIAETVLAEECPWQATRLHWLARLRRTAQGFVTWNEELNAEPRVTEKKARLHIPLPAFDLIGKPDRIDIGADGQARVYDYKTGALPSKAQQNRFSKQLILLALMIEDGAFEDIGPVPVGEARYIGLGKEFAESEADVTPENQSATREDLVKLLAHYLDPEQGFTVMRAVENEARIGDFHALARRGEWQPTDPSETINVGDPDG